MKNRRQFPIFNRRTEENRPAGYRIEAGKVDATVYLYDEISYFGVSADQFVKDFNAIDAPLIHLRVNSPGGSVFDGTTIFNAIRQHPSKVVAHVDGLAASIASVIILAADEVQMAQNAMLMIHQPWSMVMGDANDMRHEAELLDKVSGVILQHYIDKTGQEKAQLQTWMDDETWFTAQEALDAGFADSIYEQKLEKDQLNLFDLSVFNNVPARLAGCPSPAVRDLERALRDAGCSKRQAKAILACGYADSTRDAAAETEAVVASTPIEAPAPAKVCQPQAVAAKDPVRVLMLKAKALKSKIQPKVQEKQI